MKDQINTIRAALEDLDDQYNSRKWDALTALTQLEAMAGEQEPVQLDHIACIDGGELRYMTGRKAPAYDCELYAMPDGKRAAKLYAAPVAQQYEAGDIASAAAQGFRDGVASVTQQPQQVKAFRAPTKTEWGAGMVCIDIELDKDSTATVFFDQEDTAKVEHVFNAQVNHV